jgi:integrase
MQEFDFHVSHHDSLKDVPAGSSGPGFASITAPVPLVISIWTIDGVDVGWGEIRVTKAWNGAGEDWGLPVEDVGPTKTTKVRTVPLSPYVVAELRGYVEHFGITSGPMSQTRGGKPPTSSNWCRSLKRACTRAEVPVVTP